jgi:hypothetical protein
MINQHVWTIGQEYHRATTVLFLHRNSERIFRFGVTGMKRVVRGVRQALTAAPNKIQFNGVGGLRTYIERIGDQSPS